MERENLNALIDRVMGSGGILRTPVYWMKKVLKSIVEYCEADDVISETSMKPIANSVAKKYIDQNSKIVVVEIKDVSSGVILAPNILNRITDPITELTIELSEVTGDYLSIYMAEFKTDTMAYIHLPSGIEWEGGVIPVCVRGTHLLTIEGNIAKIVSDNYILENIPDINTDYLTFVALTDGVRISFTGELQYSINGGVWKTLAVNQTTPVINTGHYISFKASLVPEVMYGVGTFSCNLPVHITGNCMSLLFGDEVAGKKDLTGLEYAFYELFKGMPVRSVGMNILPATTLAEDCYGHTFQDCRYLLNAPELPASELPTACYIAMFSDDYSLKFPPILSHITRIGNQSCDYLLGNCRSLTYAPDILIDGLRFYSCRRMLKGCCNIRYIRLLSTTIGDGLTEWVDGVAANGTFVKAAGVEIPTGVNGIPEGWTVEEVAV